ncbi:hypothetical protein TWF481_005111 [Arthrobotrys musiformis]|uniref:Carboxylesterase type B domain-containing protein n=1 Tax=Arthrobotrys musiformis TaxID=47236 RepID=A0AAV9WCS9_9PEZI
MAYISVLTFLFLYNFLQILSSPRGVLASPPKIDIAGLTLSILTDNDLTGNDTPNKALLIESPNPHSSAASLCAKLSESLWSPSSNLKHPLSYQLFLSKFPSSQLFWIASSISKCTAINARGRVYDSIPCHTHLPVICTNTAPASNGTFTNTSPEWQVVRSLTPPRSNKNVVIRGYRDLHSFRFLGIRYASPPERFAQSSVMRYNDRTEISGLQYPPICLQNMGVLQGVEDCLFLNLWTPYLPSTSSRNHLKPVVVWIHGGGLVQGSANEPPSDGGNFASRGDVVFVAINYRLGNLGWLPISPPTKSGEGNGNYGLGDMQTALKWVEENIHSFGGDSSKVTIMGESGGAIAVRALLASQKSKGLISGAIIQSGAWGAPPEKAEVEYISLSKSLSTVSKSIIANLGCANSPKLRCMRSLPAKDIILNPTYVNYPLVDSRLLTGSLSATGKGPGYTLPVPILMGIVRDEIAPFNSALYGTTDPQDYLTTIGPLLLSENISHLLQNPIFSPPPIPNKAEAAFNISTRMMTDYTFTCLTFSTGYSLSKHNVVPAVYMYEFNRTYMFPVWSPEKCMPPASPQRPFGDCSKEYYKCHAGELAYTFGTMGYMGMPDRDEGGDTAFMQWMVDLWSSFVRTGDPNPKKEFLRARGYWGTIEKIEREGKWKKAVGRKGARDVRLLQLEGAVMRGYSEVEQCGAMGMGLEYYE